MDVIFVVPILLVPADVLKTSLGLGILFLNPYYKNKVK